MSEQTKTRTVESDFDKLYETPGVGVDGRIGSLINQETLKLLCKHWFLQGTLWQAQNFYNFLKPSPLSDTIDKFGMEFDASTVDQDSEGKFCWAYVCSGHKKMLLNLGATEFAISGDEFLCGVLGCASKTASDIYYLWDQRCAEARPWLGKRGALLGDCPEHKGNCPPRIYVFAVATGGPKNGAIARTSMKRWIVDRCRFGLSIRGTA